MKRFGQLIGLRPEVLEEYKRYHAAVWPEILDAIRKAGIRNYSIFHFDGKLFAYFEYTGPDDEFEARMRELARAPRMREWWDIMDAVADAGRGPRRPGTGGRTWKRCSTRTDACHSEGLRLDGVPRDPPGCGFLEDRSSPRDDAARRGSRNDAA